MEEILKSLNIPAEVISYSSNGVFSKYNLRLKPGGKVNKIEKCINEIALGLRSYSIPIIRLIPQEGVVRLEVLNSAPKVVLFNDIKNSLRNFDMKLPVALGKSHEGSDIIFDLTQAPHLLIAGTTGSGKSVMLHSIICSLILNDVRLVLIDPKNVEFSRYKSIKQLELPIINYTNDAYDALNKLSEEMDKRFELLSKEKVNDIAKYNNKKSKKMPYIVVIVDEYADLIYTAKKKFQSSISRLAQKSRACGIHIIIATQRPSSEIVTGVVKANFPSRIGCKVTSAINSRVIFGQNGAERLLGKGDAIIDAPGFNMIRFQGAMVEDKDIDSICEINKKSGWGRFIDYIKKGK